MPMAQVTAVFSLVGATADVRQMTDGWQPHKTLDGVLGIPHTRTKSFTARCPLIPTGTPTVRGFLMF